MFIATVPNRSSPPAILLRESYRVGKKVKTRTLANLSKLPSEAIEVLRHALKGEQLLPAQAFEVLHSAQHGQVEAVLLAMRQLGFSQLLSARPTPQRERVMAMVAARVLEPNSKLATTRWWHATTLPACLGVTDAGEDELYDALDWLLERQAHIEKKLARRHLDDGALAFFDLTSSYFEGEHCSLAALGHSRDGKKGKLQVNYGLLTNEQGVPVSLSVFEGNTGDPTTLLPQVTALRERFSLHRFVLVGDRGMLTQKQIDALRDIDGVDWIAALRPDAIKSLLASGALQMDLFDQRNLFELRHEAWPGERLVACRNAQLATRRAHKRHSLLEATTKELNKVRAMVERGRLRGRDQIGVRVGKVINKYKVAKHFVLDISEDTFEFHIDAHKVDTEAALDGVYVIRTSLGGECLSAEEAVRSYKRLSQVERGFRALKSADLQVRPIYHRLESRVRAHLFLCMLAYYVQWHMREAWRPLLFCDEDLDAKRSRDPVAPAERSEAALRKVHTRTLDDGSETHSFATLLQRLSAIVRNTCHIPTTDTNPGGHVFEVDTRPDDKQQRALDLLHNITV